MSCSTNDQPPAPPPPQPGVRMVKCAKLQRELAALTWKPYQNALGQRIYDEISLEAWKMWTETAKMILNEYKLNLSTPEAQKLLFEQAESFFFGPGAALPAGYVPPQSK